MRPILFTLYVSCLFNIISQHFPSVHGYADDAQILTSPSDLALSIPKLTLSLRLRCALLMFVLGLLLIV